MDDRLDIEQQWPDAFDGLDDGQRRTVVQTLANGWHEGWEPNREDVVDLAALTVGRIDEAEYDRRTLARVAQLRTPDA